MGYAALTVLAWRSDVAAGTTAAAPVPGPPPPEAEAVVDEEFGGHRQAGPDGHDSGAKGRRRPSRRRDGGLYTACTRHGADVETVVQEDADAVGLSVPPART